MTHFNRACEGDRRALEALVVDNRNLDRLEDLLSDYNLFEAVGATRTELRHSDFLRFLLDPSANHGLGDYFLKTLMKRCLAGTDAQPLSAIDIDVADLADAVVERERWSIDILVHSERHRMVVAIENKVDALERGDQLDRYRETVEREFREYRRVFVFLTPEGDSPSDADRWISLSYATLADVVKRTAEARRSVMGAAVHTTLEHYAAMIGRHIVSESEIARLCQQIYRQHKQALDLIFEHRPDLQTELKTILEEEVSRHPTLVLDHCTKSRVRFAPASWDRDPRQGAGHGWTQYKRVLLFEFYNDAESLKLKLVVGPVTRDNEQGQIFRRQIFDVSVKARAEFPGGMPTLAPRYSSLLSKELVKRKDYAEPDAVPDKAREAVRAVLTDEVPKVVRRMAEIFGPA